MRIGDEASGFSLDVELGASVLHVRAWGFWSADTARSFGDAVVESCNATRSINRLILDMTRLKPMREEGQESFVRLMDAVAALRIDKVTVLTSNALTRLQLLRLSATTKARKIIEFATAEQ